MTIDSEYALEDAGYLIVPLWDVEHGIPLGPTATGIAVMEYERATSDASPTSTLRHYSSRY